MTLQWSPLPEWEVFGWSIGQKYRLGGSSWNISNKFQRKQDLLYSCLPKATQNFEMHGKLHISICLFSKKEEKSSGPDMRLIHNNANYCTILHYLIFTWYYLVLDGISERILSTTLHKGFTENHTVQKNISVQLIFFY